MIKDLADRQSLIDGLGEHTVKEVLCLRAQFARNFVVFQVELLFAYTAAALPAVVVPKW